MIKTIKNEYKFFIAILILFCVNLSQFWLKQGSLVIDCGREFYIPWQMLKGEILYKDIFNIYGPLAYQINSLGFQLLGQKISSLYFLGALNSLIITITTYFLSREFLNKKLSFIICLIVMYCGVFTTSLFNYNLPYSFAMTYSYSAFLISTLFLIKYVKTPSETSIILSSFFAGLCLACKYDFVFIPVVISSIVGIKLYKKQLPISFLIKIILAFLVSFLTPFIILFLQGLKLEDLISSAMLIRKMAQTQSLHYLYTHVSGTYFNLRIFSIVIKKFIPLFILYWTIFFANYYIEKKQIKNFLLSGILLAASYLALMSFGATLTPFGFFPVLCLLLAIIFIKKITQDKAMLVFTIISLLSSIKSFFALNLMTYGVFVFPQLILFMTIIFCRQSSTTRKSFITVLCAICLLFVTKSYTSITNSSLTKLTTKKGTIYTNEKVAEAYKEALFFFEQKEDENAELLVWSETPFLNFFTDLDSDNTYTTLIPLYSELFGEKAIIKKLETTKPKYIIFTNRDTSDYGKRYICEDYAQKICTYVKKNYASVKIFGDDAYKMTLYERK